MLFATEAFESFNAVIRSKSVHSNRHAPSRDIARTFAQCNRVRHLFSRGLFLLRDHVDVKHALTPQKKDVLRPASSATCRAPFSRDKRMWVTLGRSALAVVATPSAATDYLGLTDKKKDSNKWGMRSVSFYC